jgi:hypothetical protein
MRESNLLPQPVHQRIWKKFRFGLPVRDGDPPGVTLIRNGAGLVNPNL